MSQYILAPIHVDELTQNCLILGTANQFQASDYPLLGDGNSNTGILLPPPVNVRFRFSDWSAAGINDPISTITSFHFEVLIANESHVKANLAGAVEIDIPQAGGGYVTQTTNELPGQFVGNKQNQYVSFNVGNPEANGNLQSPTQFLNPTLNAIDVENVFGTIRLRLLPSSFAVQVSQIRMVVNTSVIPAGMVILSPHSGYVLIRDGRVSI